VSAGGIANSSVSQHDSLCALIDRYPSCFALSLFHQPHLTNPLFPFSASQGQQTNRPSLMAIHLFSSHAANGTICLRPLPNEHGKNLAIGVTAKTFMTYMTAACLAITTLSAFVLKSQHLLRYTRPKEQRQIIRIVFMPAWFCLVSMLSMLSYEHSIYFRPITDVYEAWCIPGLFLLYLEYVCPDEGARAKYFANLPVGEKKGQKLPQDTGAKWIKVRNPKA
jgi:hypothetical protein